MGKLTAIFALQSLIVGNGRRRRTVFTTATLLAAVQLWMLGRQHSTLPIRKMLGSFALEPAPGSESSLSLSF